MSDTEDKVLVDKYELQALRESSQNVAQLTEFMSTDFLGIKHAQWYGRSCVDAALHFLKTHPERQGEPQAQADAKRLKWLEDNNTLHQSVEILYVVDGYEVQVIDEDGATGLSPRFHGATLGEAIDAAISSISPRTP